MNGNWHETRRVHEALCCAVLCHSVMPDSLRPHGLYSLPDSSVHGDSLGKNIGVGYHGLLQGIFQTQGLNPGLSLQADSLPAEPPGKPKNTRMG